MLLLVIVRVDTSITDIRMKIALLLSALCPQVFVKVDIPFMDELMGLLTFLSIVCFLLPQNAVVQVIVLKDN